MKEKLLNEKDTINLVFEKRNSILNPLQGGFGRSVRTAVFSCIDRSLDSRKGNLFENLFRKYGKCNGQTKVGNRDLDYQRINEDVIYDVELKLKDDLDCKKFYIEKGVIVEKSNTLYNNSFINKKRHESCIVFLTEEEKGVKRAGEITVISGIKSAIRYFNIYSTNEYEEICRQIDEEINNYDTEPKIDWDDKSFIEDVLSTMDVYDLLDMLKDEKMAKIISALSPNGNFENAIRSQIGAIKIRPLSFAQKV